MEYGSKEILMKAVHNKILEDSNITVLSWSSFYTSGRVFDKEDTLTNLRNAVAWSIIYKLKVIK